MRKRTVHTLAPATNRRSTIARSLADVLPARRTLTCVTMLALSAVFASAARAGEVTLYPAPEGQPLSDDYKVTVDGKPLDIYRAPVWEPGYGVPSFGGLVPRWNVAIFAVNTKPDRTRTDEYFRSTFDKDYLAPLGGEGKCVLTAGASVKYADETGAEKTAEVVPISANLISWLLAPKGEANAGRRVAYAFCYIKSDKDQKADFYFGGDDEANVWVNGAPVLKTYAARDAQARQDAFTVDLKKGLNPVLVKASQRSLNWQFVLEAMPAPAK